MRHDRLSCCIESIHLLGRLLWASICIVMILIAGLCPVPPVPSSPWDIYSPTFVPRALHRLRHYIHGYERAVTAHQMANRKFAAYQTTGDLRLLDDATRSMRKAIELAPQPVDVTFLGGLSIMLFTWFERLGVESDIDEAISLLRRVIDSIPDGHPIRLDWLDRLGTALHARFYRFRELQHINEAIYIRRAVAEIVPEAHFGKPFALNSVAISLMTRFESLGDISDLENAILAWRLAVDLSPYDHPMKPVWLDSLGSSLNIRYERLGGLDDLERAIAMQRLAVTLVPDGHLGKLDGLYKLVLYLRARFHRLGSIEDLDDAISLHHLIIKHAPSEHPSKPTWLHSLGVSLQARFERVGDLSDLEQAIKVQRLAVEQMPAHPGWLRGLSSSLRTRFERLGDLDDLEGAITIQRRVVDLIPDSHPDKALQYISLGKALRARFRRLGHLTDLEEAIVLQRSSVELAHDGNPQKPMWLGDITVSLFNRFERLHELDDLESAISTQLIANDLLPVDHPERLTGLVNLSNYLACRFVCLGNLEDLERAISGHKTVVELLPDSHPDRPTSIHNLAASLQTRFERDQTQENFDKAVECFMEATMVPLGNPSIRMASALECVALLMRYSQFSSEESVLLAYSRILNMLPEIVWLGHSVSRRYEETAKLGELVSGAVSAAIRSNALPQAIEWLEAGRSLVWSQILSLRIPFVELKQCYPQLAKELQEISENLRSSGHVSQFSDTQADSHHPASPNEAADRHREQVIRYDHVLADVRQCPGFEDFLRPPKLMSLVPSLEHTDGPVVFINVHGSSCDALAFFPNGSIEHIALPDLTESRAHKLHSLWRLNLERCNVRTRAAVPPDLANSHGTASMFGRILTRLWMWVVHPILQHLDFANTASSSLPHITWCPTGPLTQLPLHAAGLYDTTETHKPRVFDMAVSSYTPSLSALVRCRQNLKTSMSSQPNALVIVQPATPGLSALPGTRDECDRLRTVLSLGTYTILEHDQAIVAHTLAVMNQHPWVHFACHGTQNAADPTQSAFALYDGPLTLSMLMSTTSENAELAFLSACQTALGDEKVPEEAVHLAAGMLTIGFRGIVATMWSIGDREAPVVVEAYYKKLLELRSSDAVWPGYTGAAYALHEAARVLRDHVGESDFVKWAPFVHFGV